MTHQNTDIRLNTWLFWQDKTQSCSFWKEPLSSKNSEEADVLQGPKEVAGMRGRGDTTVLSCQASNRLQTVAIKHRAPSPKAGKSQNMINCSDSEVKPFRDHLSYTDMKLPMMRSLRDNVLNVCIVYKALWLRINHVSQEGMTPL